MATTMADRQRLAWIVGLLVVWYAFYHNARFPVLRFPHPTANYVIVAMAMLLPGAALLLADTLRSMILRVVVGICTGLACLPAALYLLLAFVGVVTTVFRGGVDGGFEPIQAVAVDRSILRVYRTNGGATTAFGIVVRQEMTIAPGVRLVRNVYSAYPADTAQVGAVTRRAAVIDADTVRLRPLVGF